MAFHNFVNQAAASQVLQDNDPRAVLTSGITFEQTRQHSFAGAVDPHSLPRIGGPLHR